ncbi:MAG: hypothetical protein M3Q09_04145 [Gemmatimonadota bacterium]|nr:hypothetical protein [Gemmatimonadota bacterium]
MNGAALAPVVLFVYDRPEHTRNTLLALSANRLAAESALHVFCDGPKSSATDADRRRIEEVRHLVRSRAWCGRVTVHERDVNLGLASSIRDGVDTILESHDSIIVLEDDIVTSPGFLQYMNDALSVYSAREYVMHVTGYLPRTSYQWALPPTFLARYMSCWGWRTWRRAWKLARWNAAELLGDLDRHPGGRQQFDLGGTAGFAEQLEANRRGELRTWAVYWGVSIYLAGGLCVFPGRSLVRNVGTDGTGENFTTDQSERYDVELADRIGVRVHPNRESVRGRAYLRAFHRHGKHSGLRRRAWLALGRAKHRAPQTLR